MSSILSTVRKSGPIKPPRTIIYGTDKIGKTTFAAGAPSPVFIAAEDGEGLLDVPMFPKAESYDDVEAALIALRDEKHDYQTLVVDSLDWLEPLIWDAVARESNVSHIEDLKYGKGYLKARDKWARFVGLLNNLRDERRMGVILICHSEIKRFDSPTSQPYDRYQLKLHRLASALVSEWADVIGFAHFRVRIKTEDVGFSKEIHRAESLGRVLYMEEQPAFDAGNRYGLPAFIPLDYTEYRNALKQVLASARPKAEPRTETTDTTETATEAA